MTSIIKKDFSANFCWNCNVGNLSNLLFSIEDDDEHNWIVKTCRKGWDEYVGFKPTVPVS